MTCNGTECVQYRLQDGAVEVTLKTEDKAQLLNPQQGLLFETGRADEQMTMLGWYKPVRVMDDLIRQESTVVYVLVSDETAEAKALAQQAIQRVDELTAAIERGLSV